MTLALSYYALLIVAWIGAWLLAGHLGLEAQSDAIQTVYWTLAKLLIWLLPVAAIIRICLGEPIWTYLGLDRFRSGLKVGLLCGVGYALLSFLRDVFTSRFGAPSLSPGLLNALLIAPVFEEIVFRGFLLTSLQRAKLSFWAANIVTALLFLGLHLPGWNFMASSKLSQGVVMLGIVLTGLVAGFAREKSASLWGSIVVHGVNNLYSAFVR